MPKFAIVVEKDAQDVVLKFKRLGAEITQAADLYPDYQTIAEKALAVVKSKTPGPGKMRSLWVIQRQEAKKSVSLTIRNLMDETASGAKILSYMEFGTKPHVIVPKNARALRFFLENKAIFSKRVNHPGTRPYRMLASGERYILNSLQDLADRIAKKISNTATS